ncbi:MAG: GNAT family N-acetyltransferase, partial [Bacteroidetes bacterium]|nr:GNAT family N-acetyltransferase [Bacteroidota bacterium]
MKIGQQLLTYAIKYCINHPEIVWLDLEVMTNNIPAVNLYLKNDFNIVANYADMFRIEGKSFDYTAMTLKVG